MIYIDLIDISVELGIEIFFKDGYIDLIEFYTYEKKGMEKYQIMIFTKKKIDYPCLNR